jgi:hypothetical protein
MPVLHRSCGARSWAALSLLSRRSYPPPRPRPLTHQRRQCCRRYGVHGNHTDMSGFHWLTPDLCSPSAAVERSHHGRSRPKGLGFSGPGFVVPQPRAGNAPISRHGRYGRGEAALLQPSCHRARYATALVIGGIHHIRICHWARSRLNAMSTPERRKRPPSRPGFLVTAQLVASPATCQTNVQSVCISGSKTSASPRSRRLGSAGNSRTTLMDPSMYTPGAAPGPPLHMQGPIPEESGASQVRSSVVDQAYFLADSERRGTVDSCCHGNAVLKGA